MTSHPLASRSACPSDASRLWRTSQSAVALLSLHGHRSCRCHCTTTTGHSGPPTPSHHSATPRHSRIPVELCPYTTRDLRQVASRQCHTIALDLSILTRHRWLQNTPGASTSRRSRKPSTSPRAVMARRQAELAAGGRAEMTAGPSGKRMRALDEDEGSPQKKARKMKTRDMNADEGIAFKHDRPVRKDDVFDEGSSIMVEEMCTPAADDDEVGWDADSDAPAVSSPAKFDGSWSPQSLGNASAGLADGSSSPVVTAERLLQRAQGMEEDEDELVDEEDVSRPILTRIPGPPLVMPWEAVSPVASAGDLDDEERSVGWPNGTQRRAPYADEEHVIRPIEGVHDQGDGPFDDIYAEEYGATNAAPEEDEGEYFEYDKEPFEQENGVETGRGELPPSPVRTNRNSPFTSARPSNRAEPRSVKPRFLLSPLIAPITLPPPLVFEEHLEQPIPTPLRTDNPRKFHALFPDQEPTSPSGLLRQLRLTQAEVGRLELIEVRWEHAFHEALKEMGRQSVQLREQEEKMREQEERMRVQAQAMAENEMIAQGAQVVQQQMAEELAQLHQLVDRLMGTMAKAEREQGEELRKKAEELEEMKREKEEMKRDEEGLRRLLEETRKERDEARRQIAAMTTGNTKRKGSPCEDEDRDLAEQETCRSPKKLRSNPTQAKLVYHGPLRVGPTEA
ncbi:hypothetical protein K523DRAFT_343122 [Schizophyllum commune Tattone D]|nr:hypothetical protein K523DRAFT_343122 [Schizophyllum commune Tattone D]